MRAFGLAALLATPVAAQDTGMNEPPVMRLIFDDCMGFVLEDREPFVGLDTVSLPQPVFHQDVSTWREPDVLRDAGLQLLLFPGGSNDARRIVDMGGFSVIQGAAPAASTTTD